MTRQRLGIVFGDALYPERLSGTAPPAIDRAPRPLAIHNLLRCIPFYEVIIYPPEPHPDRAALIFGWLNGQLRIWYERAGQADASLLAEETSRHLDICDRRPDRVDREVASDEDWPTDAEIRAIMIGQMHEGPRIVKIARR